MTSQKPKKFVSIMLVLTMILTLLPATLGFAASYSSIEQFVENVYEAGLGRKPDEAGYNYWVKELKNGRPAAEFIGYVLLDSPEFAEKYAKISNEDFAKKAYEIVFNRAADAEGLKFWVSEMNKGGSHRYVIVAMLYAPEFAEFCEAAGIKLGTLTVPADEYPGTEPAKLEVVDVSATNVKEIVVSFNRELNDEEAKQAAKINNYTLDGNVLTNASEAVVQSDKSKVVIELRANGPTLTNQRNHKLVIKGITGLGTVEKTFAPLDVYVPKVEKVEMLGNKVINVTFSEPVRQATATTRANYRVDGFVVNGNLTLSDDLKTVSINLYSRLTAGQHKINVSGVTDYQNMTIVNLVDHAFTVVEDKNAPASFVVENATLEYAVIKFDEAIDSSSLSASKIYWSDNNGTTKYTADSVSRVDSTYELYKVTFPEGRRLPAGRTTTLYVEGAMDMYGNTAAKLSASVSAEVDTLRPEIIEIDFAKNANGNYYTSQNIDLTWNKVVPITVNSKNQFAGNNVTVKNSKGEIVAIGSNAVYVANTSNKTIRVTLTNSLTQGTTYTVEVSNITDGTTLSNKMIPQTFTLTVPEYSAPTVNAVNVQKNYSGSQLVDTQIQVVFSNVMALGGSNNILDASKYMIRVNSTQINAGTWYQLPAGTLIQPSFDNRAAIISIPGDARFDGNNTLASFYVTGVKVSMVEDRSANLLVTDEVYFGTARWGITAAAVYDLDDREPVATGRKTIRLTYDKPLQYVVPTDFTVVTDGSVNPVVSATHEAITVAGQSRGEVILTLQNNMSYNPSITISVKANPDSRDLLGNAIATQTISSVRDGIAPALASSTNNTGITAIGPNKIAVVFTEPVKLPTGYTITDLSAMFTVTHGLNDKALTPVKDYTVEFGNNGATPPVQDRVIITLKTAVNNLKMTVATNNNAMLIIDGATPESKANKVSFSATEVTDVSLINVASLSNATVTSTVYTVNNTANTITNVAYGTAVATFKSNLTVAGTGATFEVYESDGTTVRTGTVVTGDLVKVTAGDGTTTKTYTITVNAPSSDASVTSTVYQVGANSITDVPSGTDVSDFKANLTPANGATFEVYESDGTTVRTGTVVTGDLVKVTAQDMTSIKTYVIVVLP